MKNKKVLIISARYYEDFSNSLELVASSLLHDKKVKYKIIKVPGVFEIPVSISKNIKKYDGFVALGCVIKGETPHFDFISQVTTNAIMQLSIEHKKPIGNGIITSLNREQALTRSKTKGGEAARAVISILFQ
jgi:6,7-dimethyl-8-ribityllumazine synthase